MTTFQRLAFAAYACLVALVFMGAIVRATGSGLGCPDWPFCYGRMVPPTTAEDIDFTQVSLEKFRRKAAQHGRDPASITPSLLRAEFDPVKTWIEYLNRLSSLPLSLAVLGMMVASLRQIRPIKIASSVALLLLLINAWLGARVVFSGLQPGIITTHMALAMIMLCVLVYAWWRAAPRPWRFNDARAPFTLAITLFLLIVIEGIMGSQVRELTDTLAKTHLGQPRSAWTTELEQSWVYLLHRSFSWLILIAGIAFTIKAKQSIMLERCVLCIVLSQMVLGIVLSHIGILALAQVLHVGLSAMLVSALFLWLLAARR